MSKAAESAALARVASKGVYAGGGPIAEADFKRNRYGFGQFQRGSKRIH